MNWILVGGAVATTVAAVGHSVTGERGVLRQIEASASIAAPHVRLAWHLATIIWLTGAGILAVSALTPLDAGAQTSVRLMGSGFAVSAVFTLWRTQGRNPAVRQWYCD